MMFFFGRRIGLHSLVYTVYERTVIEWRFMGGWLMTREAPVGLTLPFACALPFASLHALIRSSIVPASVGWPCASSEGALKSTCASPSCTLYSPGAVVFAVCTAYFGLCYALLRDFFYFEKIDFVLLFFCNHILSVMLTSNSLDSNSVNVLESQAYAAMQKMEKQRLWRWALRGIVFNDGVM